MKLASLIMVAILVLPVSAALADSGGNMTAESAGWPSGEHGFSGGFSLDVGYDTEFGRGESNFHPELVPSINMHLATPLPKLGIYAGFAMPIVFDGFARIRLSAGPTFTIDDSLRFEFPVFYQHDQYRDANLFGFTVVSNVPVYRQEGGVPVSVLLKMSAGTFDSTNEGYISYLVGVGFYAPGY